MNTWGELKELLQDMLDDQSSETALTLLRYANRAYRDIKTCRPWSMSVKTVTLTSTANSSGVVLPSDFVKPVYVQDDKDYLYFQMDLKQRYGSQKLYNYFQSLETCTPLLTGTDLATTINGTTVTSATGGFTAAMVGEYIKIGAEGGLYKIDAVGDTNTLTLAEPFHWADFTDPDAPVALEDQYFAIRPPSTKKIMFTDENGDAIASSTLKLWYIYYPQKLYNDYDEVLLPSIEPLRIKIARMMDETDRYTNDSLKKVPDFDKAMGEMRKLDPTPVGLPQPRDKHGNITTFSRKRSTYPRIDSQGRIYL